MTDVAQLTAQLNLQSAQFERGMKSMQTGMRRAQAEAKKTNTQLKIMQGTANKAGAAMKNAIGGIVALLGAQGIGKAISFLRTVQDELDEIGKTARNLGTTAEELQKLRFAADLAGISSTALTTSMRKFSMAANEAGQGVATYADTFEKLGIEVKNSEGQLKTLDDLLLETADAFSTMDNATEKAAIAQELFGRAGLQMVGFLNQGAAGIENFKRQAEELGLVLSTEMTDAAEAFNDRMSVMSQVLRTQATRAILGLAPAIEAAMAWLVNFGASFQKFAEDAAAAGRWIVETFGKVSLAIAGIAVAIRVLMLTNPFTIIATAAITAALVIIDNWEKITAWFEFMLPATLAGVVAQFEGLRIGILNALQPIIVNVAQIFDQVINAIIGALNKGRAALAGLAEDAGGVLAELGQDTGWIIGLMARLETPIRDINTAATVAAKGVDLLGSAQAAQSAAASQARVYTEDYAIAVGNIADPAARAAAAVKGLNVEMGNLGGGDGGDTDDGGGGGKKGGSKKKGGTKKPAEKVRDFTKAVEEMNASLVQTGVDGFVSLAEGLATGESSFKDFTRNVLVDLQKLILRFIILNGLMQAVGFTSGGGMSSVGKVLEGMGAGATKFFAKGGIVDGATAFNNGGGLGVMGEAGPEAIVPLKRGSDGSLGVGAPAITVNNYSGQPVNVDTNDDMITIAVGRAVDASQQQFSRGMNTGQGTYARALEGNYTARRKAV